MLGDMSKADRMEEERPAVVEGRHVIPGFTMMEILVALAIVAVLTAVLLPVLGSKMRDARTAAIAGTLQGLSQGIAEYKKAVTRYPRSLSLLTTPPTAASLDACGNSSTPFQLWRGPYVSREMLATGTQMGDGAIQDQLRRVTAGSSTYLMIDVTGVETKSANDLETMFDGTTALPSTTGTIRTVVSGTTTDVTYSIPINGC